MNFKIKLAPTLILLFMIIPFIGFSQSMNKIAEVKATRAIQEQIWKPINKFPDYNNMMQTSPDDVGTPVLINIKNGVSFYKKSCESDTEKIGLLKVVNSNNYSVQISWQLNSSSDYVSVVIPSLSEIEGMCSVSKDENVSKLSISIPIDADTKEIVKYFHSHLQITKL
jgi:hypothetical protein